MSASDCPIESGDAGEEAALLYGSLYDIITLLGEITPTLVED
jgi:hypothetical protein